MPTQIEQLPKNINKLLDKIDQVKSKSFLVPNTPPPPNILPLVLTPRQIAKKKILIAAGVINKSGDFIENTGTGVENIITSTASFSDRDSSNNDVTQFMSDYDKNFSINAARKFSQKITPESAHFIVYGKFKRDANGRLIDNEIKDPDCVFKKLAMPDDSPTLADISMKIKKINKVLRMLGMKQIELLDDIAQLLISLPATIASIASAIAILPSGAGIPTAFANLQNLITNIMNIISKITGMTNEIEILDDIAELLPPEKIESFVAIVNAMILTLISILDILNGVTSFIPSMPTPPGIGDEPPDPIEADVSANPLVVDKFKPTNIVLKAIPNKGSWEYTYEWEGPDGFTSNEKEVKITNGVFLEDTTYKVTVRDKKNSNSSAQSEITILVKENIININPNIGGTTSGTGDLPMSGDEPVPGSGNNPSLPNHPGQISGNIYPCLNTNQIYSVTNIENIIYTWSVPSGWTINTGQGSNSILVTVGNNDGNIRVIPSNSYGNGPYDEISVIVKSSPTINLTIEGEINPCENSTQLYSTQNIEGITYTWSLPTDWAIIDGQGTNFITAVVGTSSGDIKISISDEYCGGYIAGILSVAPTTIPNLNASIIGNYNPCSDSNQTYSVYLEPGISYNWQIPDDWILNSGQGTNSINVSVGSNSGDILVYLSNLCGTSDAISQYINVNIPQIPIKPIGSTGVILSYTDTTIYKTEAQNATQFIWQLDPPEYGSIVGDSDEILVVWNGTYTGNVSLKVKSMNSCEESEWSEPLNIILYQNV